MREIIYKRNVKVEEGTVEYLSREIASKAYISGNNSYNTYVNALKDIKNIIDVESPHYDFAKRLIDIPLDERYNDIENMVEDYKRHIGEIGSTDIQKLNDSLKILKT